MPPSGVADRDLVAGSRARIPIVLGEFSGTEPLARRSHGVAPIADNAAARAKKGKIDGAIGDDGGRANVQNHWSSQARDVLQRGAMLR